MTQNRIQNGTQKEMQRAENNGMQKEILKEIQKLETIASQLRIELEDAPQGGIRSQMNRGKYPQFYYIEDGNGDKNGRYLKKNEVQIAKELVQKEYNSELLNCIEEQLKTLSYIEKKSIDGFICQRVEVYEKLSPAKRRLVIPVELSDEEFIAQWNNTTIGGLNTYPVENGFLTERGELVRSKSEKLIADKFYYRNIPYKYEPVLKFTDGSVVCPDFAILNIRKRKTIYFEHFGMMDSPDYCKAALDKMELYERNGLLIFEDIIYTMESSQKVINMVTMDRLIERFIE